MGNFYTACGGPDITDSSDSHTLFHHSQQLLHGPFQEVVTKIKGKKTWDGNQENCV